MGFFEHLEELRKRLMLAVLGITICSIAVAFFITPIMDIVLLGPASRAGLVLQNLEPFGQPFLFFKVILTIGIIASFPYTLYQLWLFIAPGLYEKERKWAGRITFFTSLCFMAGVAFSYYVMVPSMLNFAASFGTAKIKNMIDVNKYFGFISMLLLASGIFFEMPVVSFILSRFGIINYKALRKYWRHAIVVILVLAAVATPTPDPVSQLIFAAPLFVLYELSIWVAKFAGRNRN